MGSEQPQDKRLNELALSHLLPRGQVAELRAPKADAGRGYTATMGGYYNDPAKLTHDTATITAPGVYLTLNPVNPALLARCKNRCDKSTASTTDKDIIGRRWLFLDIDPERPSGICATDAEKAEARAVADAVAEHLKCAGWPDPMVVDSGSGTYLLFRIEEPADDGGTVVKCLKALAYTFDTDAAHIDTTVHNPSRIVRVPGTMNRKGDSTDDRPHRRCRVLSVPDAMQVVPYELLEALAATAADDKKKAATAGSTAGTGEYTHRLLVPEYLSHFSVEVLSTNTGDKGQTRWRIACPFDASHTGTDAYACQYPTGAVGFNCSHNSCAGNKWDAFKAKVGKPLPEHYDPPMAGGPKGTFSGQYTGGGSSSGASGGQQRSEGHKQAQQAGGRFMPELLCAAQVKVEFVQWLWTGRVPIGRGTLVAGRGGLGKTLLLCDMAATVSRGRYWPDGHQSPRGDVLFLSAEDDPGDTLVPRAMAAGADLTRVHFLRGVVADAPGGKKVRKSIDLKTGMDTIAEAVERFPELKLVIIDPIGSYLGSGTDSHRDNEVREALDGIARLAAERGFAVVFIAHVNKSSMNAFADDAILGSRAFSTFCRATQHLVGDPDDKARRLLMPGKCNLAMTPAGLAYTVEQVEVAGAGDQPRVCWCPDPVEGDANDFVGLGGRTAGPGERAGGTSGAGGERKEAGELLLLLLADKPRPLDDIKAQTAAAGLSWATVKRAKTEAGITGKPESKTFEPGKPPPYWWGIGEDWQFPTPEEAQPATTPDLPLISQEAEPLREEEGQKPGNTAEIPEEAQGVEGVELLRSGEPVRPEEAQGAEPARRGSTPQTVEPLRETVGEKLIPAEEAQPTCEIRDTPKPAPRRRGKKTPSTPPPADPLRDTDACLDAVKRAGWTEAQAVAWLLSQGEDEFVPGAELAGTHGGQRAKLLDHLATLDAREVQA